MYNLKYGPPLAKPEARDDKELISNLVDAPTRDAWNEFLGRDPHPSGAAEPFYVIQQPKFPQFRFEWHTQKRKLYLIRLNNKPLIGEIMAEHVDTHGQAYNFVQTWLRGYKEGLAPNIVKTDLIG